MLMLAYSATLTLGLLLSAPWWAVRMLTTDRYRKGLSERLGRVPARLRAFVEAEGPGAAGEKARRLIWVHAVSVGEVLAISRLVSELEAAPGAEWRVVVSTTTRTGQVLARERFGAEQVFYFPLDFAWAVRAYLRVLRPAVLVLAESELWPRLLHECGRAGVPVAVVNARISDRSFRRAMKVRAAWRRILQRVTLWLAQSEEDARRLVAMGAREAAVRVVGNLKYDVRAPEKSRVAELIQEAAAGRPVIVAGSITGSESHSAPSEEQQILAAWSKLRGRVKALLVLAPRHPERFRQTESWLEEFRYSRASGFNASEKGTPPCAMKPREDGAPDLEDGVSDLEIILLDTIGDLAAVYGVADVAFVGGSLVKRGGHNPLEPAQFGVPVVMGPSFENFRNVVGKMQAAGAIRIVGANRTAGLSAPAAKNAASGRDDNRNSLRRNNKVALVEEQVALAKELEAVLLELLTDPDAAQAMGERGRRVFEQQGGATARTVVALGDLIRAQSMTRESKTADSNPGVRP